MAKLPDRMFERIGMDEPPNFQEDYEEERNEPFMSIRPYPGKCCPDNDCLYGGFPQQETCRGCGKLHKNCKLFESEEDLIENGHGD